MPQATISVRRGFGRSAVADVHQAKSPTSFGWSNIDLKALASLSGDEPVKFLLRILLSAKGDETNTTYDVYEDGIGLGIPSDQVDVTSFTDIQLHDDYDSNQRVFFKFKEPQPAKKYIEDEICRPFGYYLLTGNDGRLKLVRPRHPQKFLISRANNEIKAEYPTGGEGDSVNLTLGIYTAQQLASHVELKLNSLGHDGNTYTCTYNTDDHEFAVHKGGDAFDMLAGDKAWQTLGFTDLPRINVTVEQVANVEKGAFSGQTLDKNSLRDVSLIENRSDQITGVTYLFNYKLSTDEYEGQLRYVDAEGVNLGDTLGARELVIKSKGLVSADTPNPWHLFKAGASCEPEILKPDPNHGLRTESWAQTYAFMLLDRYKQPPLKFKAKLAWEHNLLEVGDVVRLDYDIAGVFADYELDKSVIAGRLFEIVQLNPNFRDGFLDATFLGHRYVSY